jgi:hypothetical protein
MVMRLRRVVRGGSGLLMRGFLRNAEDILLDVRHADFEREARVEAYASLKR